MMKILHSTIISTVVLLISSINTTSAQDTGEITFKQNCATCHTIGKGKFVGPDLAHVTERRTSDWLLKFIKSPQAAIDNKDKTADSLFQAYNKVLMPDQAALSDVQINDILGYIKTKSTSLAVADNTSQPENQIAKKEDNWFTRTNMLLMGTMLIMLIVIFTLARINKSLADQIRDYYSSDRAFLKK